MSWDKDIFRNFYDEDLYAFLSILGMYSIPTSLVG